MIENQKGWKWMNQSSFQLKKLGGEVRRRETENKSEENWRKKTGKIKVDNNNNKKKTIELTCSLEELMERQTVDMLVKRQKKDKILSQKL